MWDSSLLAYSTHSGFKTNYVLWQDCNGNIYGLPNACPHMGAMLSEGWCVTKPDGSSVVACPFHALEFDGAGCTILPDSNKSTKSLIKPLELIIQCHHFSFCLPVGNAAKAT